MTEAALYMLSGIALYGGSHHLYQGAHQAKGHPHVLHGVMYLLLAGFAVTSALSTQPQALSSLLPIGQLTVTLGLLLWATLGWFMVSCSPVKLRPALAGLTAVWALLLAGNLASPYSLVYSRWWYMTELVMLASTTLAAYAGYRMYRQGEARNALILGTGLSVLLLTTILDHLVMIQVIQLGFLVPVGFLAVLVAGSLVWLRNEQRKAIKVEEPAPTYNVMVNLPPVSEETRAAAAEQPLQAGGKETPAEPEPAALAHDLTEPGFSFEAVEETAAEEQPAAKHAAVEEIVETAAAIPETEIELTEPVEEPAAVTPLESSTREQLQALHEVLGNLTDIQVYSGMALRRYERGDAGSEKLVTLFRKIHQEAIEARGFIDQSIEHDAPPPEEPPPTRH